MVLAFTVFHLKGDKIMNRSSLCWSIVAVLGIAALVAITEFQLRNDTRNMTPEEKLAMHAIYEKADTMPAGSFVTLEEEFIDENGLYQKANRTYCVRELRVAGGYAAYLEGPAPQSNAYLHGEHKWLYPLNILRGPNADHKIVSVLSKDEDGWQEMANWYFIQ